MSVTLTLEQEIKIVNDLGKNIGYGHLMSLTSALWRKMLVEKYGSPAGAFIPTIIQFCNKEGKECAAKDIKNYDEIIKNNCG